MVSLAYLAYCGDAITTADPDPQIASLISAEMDQIPVLCTGGAPNWSQVWGPVSYTTPGSLYQDSLMYLVRNRHVANQYAVAIRGTNRVSDLDWLMDDFDVLQQMPWPPGSAAGAATGKISESTSIALAVLLGMRDGTQTLLQCLSGVTGSAIDLCVTGHSLGGCLASAFGLYLTENRAAWDHNGGSVVSCVTFAAPTAGDGDFARLVETAFPDGNFDRVRCSLDIVPLAWEAKNIVTLAGSSWDNNTSNIFDIYDEKKSRTGIDFSEMEFPEDDVWNDAVLDSVLVTLQNFFTPLNYTQPFPEAAPLAGTYDDAYVAYDENFETTATAFAAQAAYQHSESYPILLGVPELNTLSAVRRSESAIGAAAVASRPRAQFVRSLIGAAFDGVKKTKLKAPTAVDGQDGPPSA